MKSVRTFSKKYLCYHKVVLVVKTITLTLKVEMFNLCFSFDVAQHTNETCLCI